MTSDSLAALSQRLQTFAADRNWEQFHSPKNLAMAVTAEAGELAAEFQWLDGEQSASLSAEHRARVADEMADVLSYLVRLASRLNIDLVAATNAKIDRNELRFPVDQVRGSARESGEY